MNCAHTAPASRHGLQCPPSVCTGPSAARPSVVSLRICPRPGLTPAGLEERLLRARQQPRGPGSPPHLAHGGPLPVHPGRVPGRDGAPHPPGPPAGAAAPPRQRPPGWHPPCSPAQLAPGVGLPPAWTACCAAGLALCDHACLPRLVLCSATVTPVVAITATRATAALTRNRSEEPCARWVRHLRPGEGKGAGLPSLAMLGCALAVLPVRLDCQGRRCMSWSTGCYQPVMEVHSGPCLLGGSKDTASMLARQGPAN